MKLEELDIKLKNLFNQKEYDLALKLGKKIIKTYPSYFFGWKLIGTLYCMSKNSDVGLKYLKQALIINQNDVELHNNIGNVYKEQKNLNEAEKYFKKAIQINPNFTLGHYNLANTLSELNRLNDAAKYYQIAISLNPNNPKVYYNFANLLEKQSKYTKAEKNYKKAISLKPDYTNAYNNLAMTLVSTGKIEEGIVFFNKLIALNPQYKFAIGNILKAKISICLWDENYFKFRELLHNYVKKDLDSINPFVALKLIDSQQVLQKISQRYALYEQYDKIKKIDIQIKKHNKIKIAYFSVEFCNHPGYQLLNKVLKLHDRNKFEVYIFYFHPTKFDEKTEDIKKSVDHFYYIKDMSDEDIVNLSRELEIDISVNETGYTKHHRTALFAYRTAPIQISYLAFPSTMGVDFMDYIIADEFIIPKNTQKYFNEKVLYLPNCYQPSNYEEIENESLPTKSEFGLPEDKFIFCSFNHPSKLTPEIFSVWMEILHSVSNSVLWIYANNKLVESNILKEVTKSGIDNNRVIFAKPLPNKKHIRRQKLADLFLDSFPCTAHTTASEALYMGLPLITMVGESFASRVSASLLNTLDLNELITYSIEEYKNLAISLSTDINKFNAIKRKLDESKLTSPLFDITIYTKNLEKAYIQIYEQKLNNTMDKSIN